APLRAAAGSDDRVGSSEVRYTWERMEPRTATLSATATWRAVLVSADPAPARPRGNAAMVLEGAGGSARPSREPWTKNMTATIQIGEAAVRNAQPPMATAFISMPATPTARAP